MATKSRSNNKSDARKGAASSTGASSETGFAGAQTDSADAIGPEAMSQASVTTQFAQQAAVLQDWSHQQPSNARLQDFAAGKAGTPAHQAAATAVLAAKAEGATTGQAVAATREAMQARESERLDYVAKAISGGSSKVLNAGSAFLGGESQSLSGYTKATTEHAVAATQAETLSALEQGHSLGASGKDLAELKARDAALSKMQGEDWSLSAIQNAAEGEGVSVAQQSAAMAVLAEMEAVSRSSGTGVTMAPDRTASVDSGGSGLHANLRSTEASLADSQESSSHSGSAGALDSKQDMGGSGTLANSSGAIQAALHTSLSDARAEALTLEAMAEKNWSVGDLQAAARGEGYSPAEQAAATRVLDALDRDLVSSGGSYGTDARQGVGMEIAGQADRSLRQDGFAAVSQERPDGVVETHSRTLSVETDKGRAELLADVVREGDTVSAANAMVQLRDNAIQMEDRVPDLAAAIYNSVPPSEALAASATLAREGGQVDVQAYVDSKFSADVKESAGADFREAAEQLRAEQGPRADVAAEKLEAFAEALKSGDAPAIASAQSEMVGAVADLVNDVARESSGRLAEELPSAPEGDIQRIAIHEESKETYPDGQQVSQSQSTVYEPPVPEQVVESAATRNEAASDAMQVAQVLRDAGHDVAADALEEVAVQTRTGSPEQIAAAQQEVLTAFESEFGPQGPEAESSREHQKDNGERVERAQEFAEAEKADAEHDAEMSMGD